jgi:hypothetical protein
MPFLLLLCFSLLVLARLLLVLLLLAMVLWLLIDLCYLFLLPQTLSCFALASSSLLLFLDLVALFSFSCTDNTNYKY